MSIFSCYPSSQPISMIAFACNYYHSPVESCVYQRSLTPDNLIVRVCNDHQSLPTSHSRHIHHLPFLRTFARDGLVKIPETYATEVKQKSCKCKSKTSAVWPGAFAVSAGLRVAYVVCMTLHMSHAQLCENTAHGRT